MQYFKSVWGKNCGFKKKNGIRDSNAFWVVLIKDK